MCSFLIVLFVLSLPSHFVFSHNFNKKVNLCPPCLHSKRNAVTVKRYEPNWKSLDKRPVPNWFDEAKVGIFIHWGIYSVPAFGTTSKSNGYAEWFLHEWKSKDFFKIH